MSSISILNADLNSATLARNSASQNNAHPLDVRKHDLKIEELQSAIIEQETTYFAESQNTEDDEAEKDKAILDEIARLNDPDYQIEEVNRDWGAEMQQSEQEQEERRPRENSQSQEHSRHR